jgi:hypothetical protein
MALSDDEPMQPRRREPLLTARPARRLRQQLAIRRRAASCTL